MRSLLSDPRLLVIGKRLAGIKHIVPVMSSKGGVGKTIVASILALLASRKGSVGLLDLDITNPTTHIVLGIDPARVVPSEEKGVHPPVVHGLKFMSIAYYVGDKPVPLRGREIDDVIRELLAVTIWGQLDYLFIDTPPGVSDEVLDTLSYFINPRPVIVTTPSPLAIESTRRLLVLLRDYSAEVIGVIENMSSTPTGIVKELCSRFNTRYLGYIPFYREVDKLLGSPEKLLETPIAERLKEILDTIDSVLGG